VEFEDWPANMLGNTFDPTMTRGKRLSTDLRQAIYHMSFTTSAEAISEATEVPVRTVYRIIKEGNAGEGFGPKERVKKASYKLSEQDIQVSVALSVIDLRSPAQHCVATRSTLSCLFRRTLIYISAR
jgi:hypothetical protein